MKLLICTQKVDKNDPVLGFFHRWIIEFSKYCESVIVICLERGEYDLPQNVKVLSLEKEKGNSRSGYVQNFYKYMWRERKNYDAVFVHMNQVYVVLGGIFWKMLGKKIVLWYTHRAVPTTLKMAVPFADAICTAASESFNIKTPKLHVVGHGIDLGQFPMKERKETGTIMISSVGRITRIKNLDTLVLALEILDKKGIDARVELVGPAISGDDQTYLDEIKKLISEKGLEDRILFKGSLPHDKVADVFYHNNIHVNLTPTGGIDKVVLEGILTGSIPLVSNEAFVSVFGPYADDLIFELRNPSDLASKIEHISKINYRTAMLENLRLKVETDYSLEKLIETVVDMLR